MKFDPELIEDDIYFAKFWCNSSKVAEAPGTGYGWRHAAYRLALTVEELQKENQKLKSQNKAKK